MTTARRGLAAGLALVCIAAPLRAQVSVPPGLNPVLLDLPMGRWVKIHQQRPSDTVTFVRQKHGGSAFDSRRGRLLLFGSDTHARGDWTNSPLAFDLARLEWHKLYPDDDPASYTVTAEGLPVAGPGRDHPWAMHSFGAVSYDPAADALVVASYPRHLAPGRFTDALAALWPKVARHPTWVLTLAAGRWQPLTGAPVHFFPYATAFDSHRGLVVGTRSDGVYELSLAAGRWRKVADAGLLGWGSNLVYDSRNRALLAFGSHERGNQVAAYEPASGRHRVMPTPGPRQSGSNYVPLAFHPDSGRMVALIDRPPDRAETWLYDLAGDTWTQVPEADLPFALGMNYNLEFDPRHRLLLLVAAPPGALPAVWALRL